MLIIFLQSKNHEKLNDSFESTKKLKFFFFMIKLCSYENTWKKWSSNSKFLFLFIDFPLIIIFLKLLCPFFMNNWAIPTPLIDLLKSFINSCLKMSKFCITSNNQILANSKVGKNSLSLWFQEGPKLMRALTWKLLIVNTPLAAWEWYYCRIGLKFT